MRTHTRSITFTLLLLACIASLSISSVTAQFLTHDLCRDSSECSSGLKCLRFPQGRRTECQPNVKPDSAAGSNAVCHCHPDDDNLTSCTVSLDCPAGERCARFADEPASAPSKCISCGINAKRPQVYNTVDNGTSCPDIPTPVPNGLPLDSCGGTDNLPCRTSGACVMSRNRTFTSCASGAGDCFCLDVDMPFCAGSGACGNGMRCAHVPTGGVGGRYTCASCAALKMNPIYVLTEPALPEPESCGKTPVVAPPPQGNPNVPMETPNPSPKPAHCPRPNDGLSLDPCCAELRTCKYPRECLGGPAHDRECNTGELGCYCSSKNLPSCDTSNSCLSGEGCFRVPGVQTAMCADCELARQRKLEPVVSGQSCTRSSDTTPPPPSTTAVTTTGSQSTTGQASTQGGTPVAAGNGTSTGNDSEDTTDPTGSPEVQDMDEGPTAAPICVDVGLMKHLPRSELVFRKDKRTTVLCDAHGSCATPGHVVVIAGRVMMMRMYCQLEGVQCSHAVRWVNSPRWRAGLRVAGRGGRVEMTAHAARWGTQAEEILLRAVVAAGL